jgi:cyclic beta-1,2-glucan synthetase
MSGRAAEPASVVFAKWGAGKLPQAFAVQLVHRLRDQDPKFAPALTWLDDRLSKQQMTADSAVREVHRNQGAANLTVRNLMISLRVIAEVDWKELFERFCLVDRLLAAEGRFDEMDFATRTLYRGAVQQLARGSPHSELEIAGRAMEAAPKSNGNLPVLERERRADCRYHLIGGGRREFEVALGFRKPSILRTTANAKLNFDIYAFSIVAASVVLLAAPLAVLGHLGLGVAQICVLGALGV